MLPYAKIASLLESIERAERRDKVGIAAGFLGEIPADMICPVVRLLTGELWPPWKEQEMGLGPRAIEGALGEISSVDMKSPLLSRRDLGLLAKAAILHKSQNSISVEPLDAIHVYQQLYNISKQKGPDSDHRKGAVLRGLFLRGEPIESKYIARTIMGGTSVGLGPQTMILAISMAFNARQEDVARAYALLPDLGLVAQAASRRELKDIGIAAFRPIKPMLIRYGDILDAETPRGYLPIYPGLRVQVHKVKLELSVYTIRLKSIAATLMNPPMDLLENSHDFIIEATLVVHLNGKMQSLTDVVRFINRRHLSRRNSALPALVAFDLIWLDGRDQTSLKYAERRRKLEAVVGGLNDPPLRGISLAKQRILEDKIAVEDYYAASLEEGMRGLLSRKLDAPYSPGKLSSSDYFIKLPAKIQ
jgi:DNA ligase-1